MNRRRLIILSFSEVCAIIITAGLLYWISELMAEKRLQSYIERLEKRGYTVEEHSLSDFHVDVSIRNQFFSDFTFEADYQGIDYVYFDRRIHALYFLNVNEEDRVDANIFYYKSKSLFLCMNH